MGVKSVLKILAAALVLLAAASAGAEEVGPAFDIWKREVSL